MKRVAAPYVSALKKNMELQLSVVGANFSVLSIKLKRLKQRLVDRFSVYSVLWSTKEFSGSKEKKNKSLRIMQVLMTGMQISAVNQTINL